MDKIQFLLYGASGHSKVVSSILESMNINVHGIFDDNLTLTNFNNSKILGLYDPVPKNEIFKFILSSDIGISVLKKAETFKTVYSNKTFDYMSCKKPILMLIDGISRKLVEDADCGIYVESEDINSLVKNIRFYKNNPNTIQVHGANGYNYAKLHFDRDNLANEYIEILTNHLSKINNNE